MEHNEQSNRATPGRGRVTVAGLGLIGGSIASRLKMRGFHVTGMDRSEATESEALRRGIIDAVGIDEQADIGFVATPVRAIPATAELVLERTSCPVTDVGSVKGSVVRSLAGHDRFVGGHPMAGNEMSKLRGVDPGLFEGSVWILTPRVATENEGDGYERSFLAVRSFIREEMGAEVVHIKHESHDEYVAVISHVPHILAATLMNLSRDWTEDHFTTLLQIAAGGFRDMTRIASGDPEMWVDVLLENENATLKVLDKLSADLARFRQHIASQDGAMIDQVLGTARDSRKLIPGRSKRSLAEINVRIDNEAGQVASVTLLATELGLSIHDVFFRNDNGVTATLVLVVDADQGERLLGGLLARGKRASLVPLGPTGR